MLGETTIFKTDGTKVVQHWDEMPDLEFFREAVGGSIETVPYWPNGVAFCNEDGKGMGLPHNRLAQHVWGISAHVDALAGDIVQVTGDAEFMAEL